MSDKRPVSRKEALVIGLIAGAFGLFFVLVGAGIVPPPGGTKSLHAPLWIVFCAGLTFLIACALVLLHLANGGNPNERELPASTPYWVRVAQYLLALMVFISFGLIGTWIAFGPGEREISMSMPFFSGPANEIVGRAAFGIGAVITWLCTIAVAVAGARKLRRG